MVYDVDQGYNINIVFQIKSHV